MVHEVSLLHESVLEGWDCFIWKWFSDEALQLRWCVLFSQGRAKPFSVDVMSWELSSINLFCQGEEFWPGACKQAIAAVVKCVIDLLPSFPLFYLIMWMYSCQIFLGGMLTANNFLKVRWNREAVCKQWIFDQNMTIGVPSRSEMRGRINFSKYLLSLYCWKLCCSFMLSAHMCKHKMFGVGFFLFIFFFCLG